MHTHQVIESLRHYKYIQFTEKNFIEDTSKSLMEAQRFNLSNVNGLIETYIKARFIKDSPSKNNT